jgi:hypothetical protein
MAGPPNATSAPVPAIVLSAACIILILWLGLIHFRVMPPISEASPDMSAPGLLALVGLHFMLGCLLFVSVIGCGLAACSLVMRPLAWTPSDCRMLSLPIGLCIWLLSCLIAHAVTDGHRIALALPLGAIALRYRQIRALLWAPIPGQGTHDNDRHLAMPLIILTLAFCFAASCGLLWRLPIGHIPGTLDLGDLAVYAESYHALGLGLWPMPNLGVEGVSVWPVNQLATLSAIGFDWIGAFDISLFIATSLTSFLCLATAYLIFHLGRYRREAGQPPLDATTSWSVLLLLCAATRCGSWFVESPPYAFGYPLAISLIYAAHRSKDNRSLLYLLLPLTSIAAILSKIVMLVALLSYAGCRVIAGTYAKPTRQAKIILALGAGFAALCAGAFLVKFGVLFLQIASSDGIGPLSLHNKYLEHPWKYLFGSKRAVWTASSEIMATLGMDLGLVLLLMATWLRRDRSLLMGVIAGIAAFFFYPFLFNAAATTAFLLLATWLLLNDQVTIISYGKYLPIGAGILAIVGQIFTESGGPVFAVIWLSCFAGILGQILFAQQAGAIGRIAPADPSQLSRAWQLLLPIAALAIVHAQSDGDFRFNLRYVGSQRSIVPDDLADLWRNVRQLTPPDALIFTDQTGDTPARFEGWNDYAGTSGRQFFLASWQASPLRTDATARRQRLEVNASVLQGKISPRDLDLHGRYAAFYAAMRGDTVIPNGFQRLYANEGYALYLIP